MSTISNLLIPIFSDQNSSNSSEPHEYKSEYKKVKKSAELFLIEMFKVSVAVACYFGVSLIMSTQATPVAAYAVGMLILCGAYVITARVSRFFHDAIKITFAIFLIKKICIDQAIIPFIQTVKTAYQSWSILDPSSIAIPTDLSPAATSALKTFGVGFLRFFFGIGCGGFGGVRMILDDHRKDPFLAQQDHQGNLRNFNHDRQLEYKGIDKKIITLAKFFAGYIATIRGYRREPTT